MNQLKNDLKALVLTWQVEGRINQSRIRHIKTALARLDLDAAIAAQGV